MNCTEHDRLEQIHIQRRTDSRTAAPVPGSEEFETLVLAEEKALADLKEHDAEHRCQAAD